MSRAQDYLSKTEKGDLFWSGGAVFVAAAHNVEQRDGIFFAILGMSWLLILIKVARRDPHLALHVCLVLLATTVHGARVLARRRPVAAPVFCPGRTSRTSRPSSGQPSPRRPGPTRRRS
mmetsp:Transcript_22584/g.70800  ORF Transcript_22584/g.70800 Transcript_22584/m.70800 type:complete len:119 (-) Transcript_22584:476-832(-)